MADDHPVVREGVVGLVGGQPDMSIVAEHSRAKHVRVRLMLSNGRARLTVSDDGSVGSPDQAREAGGLGLVNMQERVRRLNGRLSSRASPAPAASSRSLSPRVVSSPVFWFSQSCTTERPGMA
jgi:signal transduction histidine kinase